jgi:putative PIN family toxin of toxin-antitoxin system
MTRREVEVVLDTNTLIAGFFPGASRKIVRAWKRGDVRAVVSAAVLKEYEHIITPLPFRKRERDEVLALVRNRMLTRTVRPSRHLRVVREDPADDKFLECALAGEVKYLISSDMHLKRIGRFESVEIMTPGQFVKRHLGESKTRREGNQYQREEP